MHIQTHVMSGWCVANLFDLTPRERLLAMLAASVADVDGLGIAVSQEAYVAYHHVLGHNLLFGVGLSVLLAAFCRHRAKVFWLFLGLFHLHLVMDFYGSGPGWGIAYFWPFSRFEFVNPQAWNFFSWQNFCAAGVCLVWIRAIAIRQRRTPLEAVMPELDRKIVRIIRREK